MLFRQAQGQRRQQRTLRHRFPPGRAVNAFVSLNTKPRHLPPSSSHRYSKPPSYVSDIASPAPLQSPFGFSNCAGLQLLRSSFRLAALPCLLLPGRRPPRTSFARSGHRQRARSGARPHSLRPLAPLPQRTLVFAKNAQPRSTRALSSVAGLALFAARATGRLPLADRFATGRLKPTARLQVRRGASQRTLARIRLLKERCSDYRTSGAGFAPFPFPRQ